MRNLLPLVQMLLVVTVLLWDVALTSRIVQVRNLPRAFVALTAIAGFLLLPSLVIHLATTSSITGRAVTQVDWLWPFTVALFALQALYAALRRLVNPFIGFFIAAYTSSSRPTPCFAPSQPRVRCCRRLGSSSSPRRRAPSPSHSRRRRSSAPRFSCSCR